MTIEDVIEELGTLHGYSALLGLEPAECEALKHAVEYLRNYADLMNS